MSHACLSCPLTASEFQSSVTDTLARLDTKMDILVGPDGTNGELSRVKATLDNHGTTINRIIGVLIFLAALIPLIAVWSSNRPIRQFPDVQSQTYTVQK